MNTIITDDYIAIVEDVTEVEIVGWCKDEWMEDPELVVPAIANAIHLCYTDPGFLLKTLPK